MAFGVAQFTLSLLGFIVFSSILALWVSSRHWPWYVRATILLLAPLFVLIIHANDLCVVLLGSHFVIFLAVSYECAKANRTLADEAGAAPQLHLPKFSIRDGLIATVLTALALAFVSQLTGLTATESTTLATLGGAIGVWMLLPFALSHWSLGRLKKLGIVALAVAIACPLAGIDAKFMGFTAPNYMSRVFSWLFILPVVSLLCFLMITLTRQFLTPQTAPNSGRPLKQALRVLTVVPLAILLAFCTSRACVILSKTITVRNEPEYRAGEENGYQQLLLAGDELQRSQILSWNQKELAGATLAAELDQYQTTFDAITVALQKGNCTWIHWSGPDAKVRLAGVFSGNSGFELQKLRAIPRAYRVKTVQDLADDRFDEVITNGLTVINVASIAGRDGTNIHFLVGCAIETMGSEDVCAAIPQASDDQLQQALATLPIIYESSSTTKHATQCEEAGIALHYGWKELLAHRTFLQPLAAQQATVVAEKRRAAIRGQLLVALAVELYQRENGRVPATLAELAPQYIPSIPADPFANQEQAYLRYHPTNDGQDYVLYSLGRNGVDDQGQNTNSKNAFLDINLRSLQHESRKEYEDEAKEEAEARDKSP